MIEFIVLGALAVFGVATYLAQRAWRRRERQLPVAARRAGMSFSPTDPFNSIAVAFPLFREGDGRSVSNVMWKDGPNGNPLRVFDYGYYVERHDDSGSVRRSWHYYSCATIEHGGNWPKVQIVRRSFVDRVAKVLGMHQISLESEEFNRVFTVECEDPKFATDLIDARMMEYLLGTEGRVDFVTRGRFLLVSCGILENAIEVPILAEIASRFISNVPSVVQELYPNFPTGGGDTSDMPYIPTTPEEGPFVGGWTGTGMVGIGPNMPKPIFEFAPPPDFHAPDTWDPTPGVDHDLDGNPVEATQEDPWGEGRDLAGP